MNIWVLRNKSKAEQTVAPVEHPIETLTSPVVGPPECPQSLSIVPENIGLDDMFSFEESEINRLSPNHTFSRLKAPSMVRRTVGLNELLTMED